MNNEVGLAQHGMYVNNEAGFAQYGMCVNNFAKNLFKTTRST